jgi:hypothetical protein
MVFSNECCKCTPINYIDHNILASCNKVNIYGGRCSSNLLKGGYDRQACTGKWDLTALLGAILSPFGPADAVQFGPFD